MKQLILISIFIFQSTCIFCQTKKDSAKPFVLGLIDEIPSKELSEKRILNISLPDGYNPNDTVKYPVIYLLDGSADEDFIHVAGLVQYYSFEWMNVVPKSIVVGIANTNRQRDFTFPTTLKEEKELYPATGKSQSFINFIEKELQPYVNLHYKTSGNNSIIGQSLGGLLATEILFRKPSLFSSYYIISPSIWWDNGSILRMSTATLKGDSLHNIYIYIAVGKEGLAPCSDPRVMEVDANLLAEKLGDINSKKLTVEFDYLPDETHATIEHQAIMNGFKKMKNRMNSK